MQAFSEGISHNSVIFLSFISDFEIIDNLGDPSQGFTLGTLTLLYSRRLVIVLIIEILSTIIDRSQSTKIPALFLHKAVQIFSGVSQHNCSVKAFSVVQYNMANVTKRKGNAFEVLMNSSKKRKESNSDVNDNIPFHLKKLVNKCPQWQTTIMNLCGGDCGIFYKRMTYKEMETEVSMRNNLSNIFAGIKKRGVELAESLQKRLQAVVYEKTQKKSEAERFEQASFEKGKALRKRVYSFLYGGTIYMENVKASKRFDGLVQIKLNASQRGDVVYSRELQSLFEEINGLLEFLHTDHEKIVSFIRKRGDITRQYFVDRQAKGLAGLKIRQAAMVNKKKNLKLLGECPCAFVPLANQLISAVNSEVKICALYLCPTCPRLTMK